MQPSGIRHTAQVRVRYSETDQMGVVYHAEYLVWCEIGRTELIRRCGMSYAALERQGIFLAVSEASLRFHSPARYDDLISIDTWIEEVRSRQLSFAYQITRHGAAPDRLVSARTALIALDGAGKPRALPAEVLDLFRKSEIGSHS